MESNAAGGHALLEAWACFDVSARPYVLKDDLGRLPRARIEQGSQPVAWSELVSSDNLLDRASTELHLNLLPQPFFGNLREATVYLLLLNPGLGLTDYYGESEVESYRAALIRNLRQDFAATDHPFLFLDPRFAWHGGFAWWNRKLGGVVRDVANEVGQSTREVRKVLANVLASVELLPYHSASFSSRGLKLDALPSAQLACQFVRDFVLPRVASGKARLIVTRRARDWGVVPDERICVYSKGEARGAHLTSRTGGGKLIAQALRQHLAVQ